MDRQNTQKEMMPPAWLLMLARIFVAVILIVSGTFKIAGSPEEFALVIANYQILPADYDTILTLATLLPWVELITGFALLYGYFTRQATIICTGLFSVFLFAVISLKIRGIDLPDCGCFGGHFHPKPMQTALMDAVLLGITIYLLRNRRNPYSLDNWISASYTTPAAMKGSAKHGP